MATNTDGGTTASLSNTPQAKDDFYLADEDQVLYFAVMANDLGGSAKVLWSIDDTSDDGSTDLVAKDVAGVCEYSELGAKISLTSDGRIKYDTTLLDSLAAGQTVIDQFTYAIRLSNGTLSWATVTVTLTGTNDGPVAVADVTAVNEDSSISGSVAGNDSDIDSGAVLSYALVDPAPTGLTFNPDGSWSFDASSYDSLDEGEELVLVVPYTVTDEHGASSSSTLTITVTGTNDTPVAVADVAAVNEDASTSGSVATNDSDADAGATLSYALDDPAPAGLTFNADGSWSFDASSYDSLDQDEELVLVVPYTVTDEHGASSGANLTITVTGTNDAALISAVAGGDYDVVEAGGVANGTAGDGFAGGQVTVSDADDGEAVFQAPPSLAGTYGTFTFDPDTGQWTYVLDNSLPATEALNVGDSVTDTLTVTSADGTDTHDIVVTITGTNDSAVIGGTTSGSVTEAAASDPGTPTANGTLTAADVDNAPDTFVAVSAPAASDNGYGTFTMTAGGAWTYTLDNGNAAVDALATGGSLVDSFTVQSVDGTTQTITVTINGATDAIILPPTESGADPNDFDNLFAGSAIAGGPVTNNGSNGGDTIHGSNSTSADNLSGGNGVDQIYGHDGGDNINGQNGADMSLYGQAGNDTITGGSGADQIFGGSGDDTIYGNEPPAGNVSGDAGDTIYGGSGNDTIYGQPGNDIIIGGYGADTLTGGAGDDSFRYLSTLDTNDIITDFMASGNDQIDLSAIDANPGGSNDPFAWGGDDPTAHGLWFSYDAGTNTTTLYGDTDGNAGTAEFVLTLQNYSGFNAYNNPLTPPPDITL